MEQGLLRRLRSCGSKVNSNGDLRLEERAFELVIVGGLDVRSGVVVRGPAV